MVEMGSSFEGSNYRTQYTLYSSHGIVCIVYYTLYRKWALINSASSLLFSFLSFSPLLLSFFKLCFPPSLRFFSLSLENIHSFLTRIDFAHIHSLSLSLLLNSQFPVHP